MASSNEMYPCYGFQILENALKVARKKGLWQAHNNQSGQTTLVTVSKAHCCFFLWLPLSKSIFSIFIVETIVDPGSTDIMARLTVNFINGDETVATMFVKKEDTTDSAGRTADEKLAEILYDPGIGTIPSGQLFHGWSISTINQEDGAEYTLDTKANTVADIRTYIKSLSFAEGDVLNIYAMIMKPYAITYIDPYGISIGTENVLLPVNETETTYKINRTYTVTDGEYGADSGNVTTSYIDLQINEKVPAAAAATFTREGYKFIGWARQDEPAGAYNAETGKVDENKYREKELTSSDLWLQLNEDGTTYTEVGTTHTDVTEVAADEKMPYHALYAVWEALPVFYVYHSGVAGGKRETIYITDPDATYDLTQNLTENTLYGGYYLEGGFTAPAEVDEKIPKYNGSNWKWSVPQTEKGTAIHPVADTTYYVKEVPSTYLNPNLYVIWDTYHNVKKTGKKTGYQLINMYMMTAVDDANYQKVGYGVKGLRNITDVTTESNKVDLLDKFVITKEGEEYDSLTSESVFDVSGLILMYEKTDFIVANAQFQDVPYWITPDGLKVTGATQLKGLLGNAYYYEWALPGIRKTFTDVKISIQ